MQRRAEVESWRSKIAGERLFIYSARLGRDIEIRCHVFAKPILGKTQVSVCTKTFRLGHSKSERYPVWYSLEFASKFLKSCTKSSWIYDLHSCKSLELAKTNVDTYWSWHSNNFRHPKRNIRGLHYPAYQFTPLTYGQSNGYCPATFPTLSTSK